MVAVHAGENPFNRTSLESKLAIGTFRASICGTFNRTSLESKLNFQWRFRRSDFPFNRTSLESKLSGAAMWLNDIQGLLIAPVWNRNFQRAILDAIVDATFNRTSLESKQSFL